ncbi:MAG TPA: hypothetical protein VGM39_03935 [Kofleriaceae bacterium]|jgi:hypothetical protein
MPKSEALAPIDPAALAQVTGGTSSPASDTNALLSQVNDMLGSIKNVTAVSHQEGLQPQEMMLFMMLLQQRNQAAAPVVVAAPWSGRRWY